MKTKAIATRTTNRLIGSSHGRIAGHLPTSAKSTIRLRKRRVSGRKIRPLDLAVEARLRESISRAIPFGPKNSSRPRSLCWYVFEYAETRRGAAT
jgi:hypothetical protein